MSTPNTPTLTDEFTMKEYGWTKNQFEVIQRMYFKNLNTDQIPVFGYICKKTGLDPFVRQIYAIVRGGVLCVQTGIDGYRLIAERTGRYSPGREPVFKENDKGEIISCTAFIKKMTLDGTWHEIAATAYFKEYTDGKGFWVRMPHGQIAKCAEALALRKAFPDSLAGIYTTEEMDQADKLIQADCQDVTHEKESHEKESHEKPIDYFAGIQQEPPKPPVEDPKITSENLGILLDLLKKCSEEYKKNLLTNMKDHMGAVNYSDIPAKFTSSLLEKVKLHIQERDKK